VNRRTHVLIAAMAGAVLPLALLAGSVSPVAQAVTPVPAAMPAAPVVATSGSLSFSPVAYATNGAITATFVKTAWVKNRPVTLQSFNGTAWVRVGSTVKMSSTGKAVFVFSKAAPDATLTYRALATSYTYKAGKKKKVAPEATTAEKMIPADWNLAFRDYFSTTGPLDPATWSHALDDNYGAVGRWCSAPNVANVSVVKDRAELKVTRVTDATEVATVVAATKVKQRAARDAAIKAAKSKSALKAAKAMKVDGCPNGVFRNVRESTESANRFYMKTGILAAQVTFPIGQGMHGGVWLQSTSGAELDMIEAFGYRKGITNVVHIADGRKAMSESSKWVAKSAVNKSSWWGKSHVFSIEWTRSDIVFRMDGAETKRMKNQKLPDADYCIVMSMLTSDWETGRIKKPVNGGKKVDLAKSVMKVDWVKAWTKA